MLQRFLLPESKGVTPLYFYEARSSGISDCHHRPYIIFKLLFYHFQLPVSTSGARANSYPAPPLTASKTGSYQFNPHLTKEETITNILVKALLVFPSPDFALCLHLLPPNILDAATATDALSDAVRKLVLLNELIESGSFREFWIEFESEDLYADLVVDCMGFEESMRDAIALQTSMIAREMGRELVQGWLNVSAEELPAYCQRYDWAIDGGLVTVPLNKENEAKTTVFRESVSFSRKSLSRYTMGIVLIRRTEFHNVIRRGFEQTV